MIELRSALPNTTTLHVTDVAAALILNNPIPKTGSELTFQDANPLT